MVFSEILGWKVFAACDCEMPPVVLVSKVVMEGFGIIHMSLYQILTKNNLIEKIKDVGIYTQHFQNENKVYALN